MIDIWLDAGELDEFLARYRATDILQSAFQRVRPTLEKDLTAEPGQRRAKQPLKTDKQRRFFFWALDRGLITVPYRRTGALKAGWKVYFQLGGGQVEMAFTNTAKHADGVIGVRQWGYHQNHWPQAHRTIERHAPLILQAVEEEARRRA